MRRNLIVFQFLAPLCADSHGSFGTRVNVNCGKMETTKCTFFSIFPEGKFLFQQILCEISTFTQYNYFRMVLETSYKKEKKRFFVTNLDPGQGIRYSESVFRNRKAKWPHKEVEVSRFFLKFLVIKSLGLDPNPINPDPQTLAKNSYFIQTND